MRRIFVESVLLLFVCFFVGLFSYEWSVYKLTTDYEFVLEDHKAKAHQELLQNIADTQGNDIAINMMKGFAAETHQLLSIFPSIDKAPTTVSRFFASHPKANVFFDDERSLWLRLQGNDLVYQYSADESSLVRQKVRLENNLLWLFFGISFLIYGLGLLVIVFRRVNRLKKATLNFAKGDLSSRVDTSSSIALGTLNQSFNVMADRINLLIENNRALTNAVAHELRTPVFRLQWQADLLKDTALNNDQAEMVESIIEDTEEMEQMVDELLYYTKLDAHRQELFLESVNLCTFLEAKVSYWQKETQLDIQLASAQQAANVDVVVDKKLLKRALDNLVRNALKFATSKILIELKGNLPQLQVAIHDDGPGIAEEHLPNLFEPFYVGEKSRNKTLSGHGLGLSIVKKICDQHHASIEVQRSKILNGAEFIITFQK